MVATLYLAAAVVAPLLVSANPTRVKRQDNIDPSSTCPVICIDGVNKCGEGFGGCINRCPGEPLPTWNTKPCPAPTGTKVIKRQDQIDPTSTCPVICIDGVNKCGERFGSCLNRCPGEPLPTFNTKPCPAPTGSTKVKRQDQIDPSSTCPVVCIDGVNKCGVRWGGCVNHCPDTPLPKFSTPPCPTGTKKPRSVRDVAEEKVDCPVVCVDKVNECGVKYGTCGPMCDGKFPPMTTPPCPSATGVN